MAVVEQTETPRQMETRLKKEGHGRKLSQNKVQERLVKREVCNVVTKGTFINKKNSAYEP